MLLGDVDEHVSIESREAAVAQRPNVGGPAVVRQQRHLAHGLAVADPAPATPRAPASPGYALFEGKRPVVGLAARRRARLGPRLVHNRFWCELETTPLRRPFPGELSHADLAHAHLAAVWREVGAAAEGVILAAPGSCSERQLGLILGIARACGMPVTGLVDAAVTAADGSAGRRLLHVDLQLHRTVVSELIKERELVRRRVEAVLDRGDPRKPLVLSWRVW